MTCNAAHFQGAARQASLDFARGFKPGRMHPEGGITEPVENKIHQRKMLVRIGHSHDKSGRPIPDWVNLTSPWWMSDSTFLDIVGRSEDAGTGLRALVRMKLALSPDFGVADTLFRVVTRGPLRSWAGRARPVMEDPDPAVREAKRRPLAWLGGYEVVQNYIPGLRDFVRDEPTLCARQCFAVVPKIPLSSYVDMRFSGYGAVPFPWPP